MLGCEHQELPTTALVVSPPLLLGLKLALGGHAIHFQRHPAQGQLSDFSYPFAFLFLVVGALNQVALRIYPGPQYLLLDESPAAFHVLLCCVRPFVRVCFRALIQ